MGRTSCCSNRPPFHAAASSTRSTRRAGPGAGGSHAFGDPTAEISFAYTMNQMDLSVLPGRKCRELVDALYA